MPNLGSMLRKSLVYFGLVMVVNMLAFDLSLILLGHDFAMDLLGNIVFLQIAVLFIAAGLADFSQSFGSINLRKLLGSKVDYSRKKHEETQRSAAALVISGVWLILFVLVLAVLKAR